MIRVTRDNLLILPIEDGQRSEVAGLYVPDVAKRRPKQGIVYGKGPKVPEGDVKIGDHVVFDGRSGTKVSVDGEGIFIILPNDEVDAIISDPPNEVILVSEAIKVIDSSIAALRLDPEMDRLIRGQVGGDFRTHFLRDHNVMD